MEAFSGQWALQLERRCGKRDGPDARRAEEKLEMAFESLSEEVRELSLGTNGEVDRINGPLSPVVFLRNYVMPGRPCIITNALNHWPALHKWTNEYLCAMLRDQFVSVHCTPDGRADAIVDPVHLLSTYNCPTVSSSSLTTPPSASDGFCTEPSHNPVSIVEKTEGGKGASVADKLLTNQGSLEQDEDGNSGTGHLFVTAHVEKLVFPKALELIISGSVGGGESGGVAYAQQQNGCFLSEYGILAGDAEVHIPWATEALGCMPEAVNLWIGNPHAVTSFHKDHYENLYAVVAGEKHFTLLPPTDVHRMYIRSYPAAHYVRMKDSKNYAVVIDEPASEVPWVSIEPYSSDVNASVAKFPKYHNGPRPFTCTVRAGEILYLPSMWFHHVRQSPDSEGRTIALNFWYDMQFDIKYAYFNLLQSLAV